MFCEKYLQLGGIGNGSQAVILAGYSNLSSSVRAEHLLDMPNVQRYIEERRKVLIEKSQVDLNYIVNKHKYIADKAIPENQELNKEFLSAGQTSLKELTSIFGYYAAEKRVTMTIDGDKHLELVKELTEKAIEQHKQPF